MSRRSLVGVAHGVTRAAPIGIGRYLTRTAPIGMARRLTRAAFALACLLGGAAISSMAAAQGTPQQGLPVVSLQAGMHIIRAEVAADPSSRATGLMFRQSLGPNQGMLFVFGERAAHCFWMRNTLIALSIAFIDDSGRIVNIADMAPQTENSHCPAAPVRFALEMEQGWFERRGISAGSLLVNRQFFADGAR
jgi:uncharacterized membrane protein (UPF0127 family)